MLLLRKALCALATRHAAALKKCRVHNFMAAAVVCSLSAAGAAFGADHTWTGQAFPLPSDGGTGIPSGDTYVSQGSFDMQGPVYIDGGKLVISSDSVVTGHGDPGATTIFNHGGEIVINGTLDYRNGGHIANGYDPTGYDPNEDGRTTIEITSGPGQDKGLFQSKRFGSNFKGCYILGGPQANTYSLFSISAPDSVTFTTDQFLTKTDSPATNKFIMRDYGRLRFTNPDAVITLQGDSLRLGATKYDYDYATDPAHQAMAGKLASIKADSFVLRPTSGTTFELSSGRLYAAGRGESAHVTIGDGSDTLLLNGGELRLGDSNQIKGADVQGSIVIGSSAAVTKPDSALFVASGDWKVTGDVTLEKSGYLTVTGGVDMNNNPLEASLTVLGNFTTNGGLFAGELASLILPNGLTGSADAVLNVGGDSAGSLRASNIRMNGGQINFDPPFAADGDLSNVTTGDLSFASNQVDARVNVGRNSMVTLGSDEPDWLRSQIAKYQEDGKGTWGQSGISAALGIRAPQTLAANGGINVDGTWTTGGDAAEANKARFAANSLLAVNAAGLDGNPALSGNGTGTLEVAPDARLLIADANAGSDVIVTDDFAASSIAEEGWTQNLSTDTPLLGAVGEELATGNYVVHVKSNGSAGDIFPKLSSELAGIVDSAVAANKLNPDASQPGLRFISRAVNNDYIGDKNRTLAAATIESAARMAVIGAVPQMTLAANDAAGAAITQRTSIAQPESGIQSVDAEGNLIKSPEVRGKSFALWIMPLFQSANGFGMEAGNFDYDFSGTIGGVAIGADYTFENAIRAGITFNIGGGYAQGTGDLNKTTNDMNFWGLGAYAGWTKNNFGLSADINFTSTYNKLKQELPSSMRMDDLKSDVTAWAISTGLRAEYKFETTAIDIIPHVGLRYTNLNTDSYDVKSGGTVVDGDSFTQNIWTFPLGVSFTKKIEMGNGWHVKPIVDLNATPATGDIMAKTKVRFHGIDQEAEIDTKTMDYITYGGTAGIEFGNDNLNFGVSYHGQFGANSSAHGVFGTFRYEF